MDSSGTEVGPEVEEEVEYVEEVVYEEEVVEVEEDEEGEQAAAEEKPSSGESASQPAAAPQPDEAAPAETPAPAEEETAAEQKSEEDDTPPPSTSARDAHPDEPTPAPAPAPAQPSEPASSEAATSATASVPDGKGPAVDLDLKQLEEKAAKVAKEVSQAALDYSSKLTAGLRSAFGGGADQAAVVAGAGASLTKLAGGLTGGISSWWGSLDPAPAPKRDETAERVAASNKVRASGELQQLFGLSPEENLVEHFKCKLLQTYACNHNNHTPAIQMAFQGTLYVTDRHTCFSVEERGRKVPFKVPHSAVVRATRQRPARKGDLSDLLKMELSSGQWLAFKDFDSGSALDSALALVEHLTEAG
ncbi:hypothetical protein GPECTOR_121g438 [Gonium pectorale]|uniref:GRAM domain-containing protein n=1 Tax=Gonium pectorale TaxID=33097 RepID=A0A150FYS9_GONPE|nr:hypothetical protein GPECTOR_121g438 [Gonium pectorale]|eukprot:KXZ42738.1 hypothetical protein GPECTOR_121g438 [Gonium pectorale]